MPARLDQPFDGLLHAEGRERDDADADAPDRRNVRAISLLWQPADCAASGPRGCACRPARVRRLMRLMGLAAIYRAPKTSTPHPEHRIYPYLLKGMRIDKPNQVWCADITYIPVQRGFPYLVAIMDWASRKVLAWRLSNTMDAAFCVEALEEALARHGQPEIFNTDQGSQFTSAAFTGVLQAAGVRISMDGRGRCMDNIFIERLWRSLKYEAVYLSARAHRRFCRPARHRRLDGLLQHGASALGAGRPNAGRGPWRRRSPWTCGQAIRLAHWPIGSTTATGYNKQATGSMITNRNTP
jgi:transposase InsO family protein